MPETPNENDPIAARAGAADAQDTLRDKASAAADDLRAQAADRARDFAEQGKARASGALDEISRLIGDNARQIDGAVGEQYGDYVRRAADAVSAFSETLRDRDVDQLVEDTRAFVRQSPALAMGAAAAAGFLLARVIKSGSEAMDEAARRGRPDAAVTTGRPKGGTRGRADPASDGTDD